MMSLQQSQRGFTLVEILVTVVLISVGLLGVAALQLTTLRGNQESYVRSQASLLANDILDRMRANSTNFRSPANPYQADFNATGDAATSAGRDLRYWQDAINRTLPGGNDDAAGKIERTGNIVTVTIQWRERADGTGAADNGGLRTFKTRSEI